MIIRKLYFGAFIVALAGCKPASDVSSECSGEMAMTAVNEQFQDGLADKITATLSADTRLEGYDAAQLRAAVSAVKMKLLDVRTTSDDPNSTRKFCSARLELRLPEKVAEAAAAARTMAELDSIEKLAHQKGVKRGGGAYEADIEYSVQPTDDGKKIIAQTESDTALFEFVSEVYLSYMLNDEIRGNKVAADNAVAAEEKAEADAERELDSALGEQAAANLNAAEVENKMATERINAVWQAIPKYRRDQLLALQRAWIKTTTANCKVEAAGTSELKSQREAIRLNCESKAQWSRAGQLEQFMADESYYSEAGADAADAAE